MIMAASRGHKNIEDKLKRSVKKVNIRAHVHPLCPSRCLGATLLSSLFRLCLCFLFLRFRKVLFARVLSRCISLNVGICDHVLLLCHVIIASYQWPLSYHSDGVLSYFLRMQPNPEASASLFTLVSTAGNDARFLVQDMRRQTAKGADVNWANEVHDHTHIHVHAHVRDAILYALSVQWTHVITLFHRNYQQIHRTAVCATRLCALLMFCLNGCICLIGLEQSHAMRHHQLLFLWWRRRAWQLWWELHSRDWVPQLFSSSTLGQMLTSRRRWQ